MKRFFVFILISVLLWAMWFFLCPYSLVLLEGFDFFAALPDFTFLNLFIANVIVDHGLSGIKNGYKFEIITTHPTEIADELMTRLHRGVTEVQVHGMYSDTDRYMLVCIIHKRQIGEMMKIIKSYPDTFASFEKVNEVRELFPTLENTKDGRIILENARNIDAGKVL